MASTIVSPVPSLSEKQQFQMALNLINKKYFEYIKSNENVQIIMEKFNLLVKFKDSGPFLMNLSFTGRPAIGCTVNGFTDYLTNPPTVWINRSTATPATLVHELLHYLTHSNFRDAFKTKPDVIEGTTEYFTRKVLGRVDLHNQLEVPFAIDRTGIYDKQHTDILLGRQLLKSDLNPDKPPKDFMKKAYFLGDPTSIGILQSIVG